MCGCTVTSLHHPPTPQTLHSPSHVPLHLAFPFALSAPQEASLLYIAEWALTAPLPPGWTAHLDKAGNEYFFNLKSGVSVYEHPLDAHYRAYIEQKRKELRRSAD